MTNDVDLAAYRTILVNGLRDSVIRTCDAMADGQVRGGVALGWRQAFETGSVEAIVEHLIPDIVDETIASLLRLVDDEVLDITLIGDAGPGQTPLSQLSDGVAEGDYLGEPDGWRFQVSSERVHVW